jgi:hypothetical protein
VAANQRAGAAATAPATSNHRLCQRTASIPHATRPTAASPQKPAIISCTCAAASALAHAVTFELSTTMQPTNVVSAWPAARPVTATVPGPRRAVGEAGGRSDPALTEVVDIGPEDDPGGSGGGCVGGGGGVRFACMPSRVHRVRLRRKSGTTQLAAWHIELGLRRLAGFFVPPLLGGLAGGAESGGDVDPGVSEPA